MFTFVYSVEGTLPDWVGLLQHGWRDGVNVYTFVYSVEGTLPDWVGLLQHGWRKGVNVYNVYTVLPTPYFRAFCDQPESGQWQLCTKSVCINKNLKGERIHWAKKMNNIVPRRLYFPALQ